MANGHLTADSKDKFLAFPFRETVHLFSGIHSEIIVAYPALILNVRCGSARA